MKTEVAIINYNRQGSCKCVNVNVRFNNINHYIEGAIKNPEAKFVRKMRVTSVSNVKLCFTKVVHFSFIRKNKK